MAFLWLIPQEALVGLKEEKELEGSSRQWDVGGEGERGRGGSREGRCKRRLRAADLSKMIV